MDGVSGKFLGGLPQTCSSWRTASAALEPFAATSQFQNNLVS